MTTQNIDVMQLLSRLSAMEERLNMSYTKHLQHQISNNKKAAFSEELETYAPLLESIDLDLIYANLRFRCDKDLYDRYKSRREKNGSFYIEDADKFEMIQFLFENCSDEEEIIHMSNDETFVPYDSATPSRRVNAVSSLLIKHLNDKIKLDSENKVLFYKDDESFKVISDYTDESFARFLAAPVTHFINDQEIQDALKKFKISAARKYKKSDVIQFNDCYLEKGICKPGFYPDGFPRFMIKRDVYQAYSTEKTTVHSKALDQLIMNLCNYDEATKERFLDVISTVFLNDSRFKKKYNFSPRIVGKDGGNGKSSFRSVIENAFRSIDLSLSSESKDGNVCSFETKDLSNDRIKYSVVNSLIAIDGDSSTSQISEDACAIFKQITSGDDVLIRPLYGESIARTAITMMISFSNDFPASSDKSSAYLRRLEYIKCDYQIHDKEHAYELGANSKIQKFEVDDDWFDEILSDRAAQYLIEDMIIRAKRILKTGKISPASQHMIDLKMEFAFSNNSSLAFLKEFAESSIVGFSVKEVKEMYREWCEDNDLTIMKRKFNETLESRGFTRIRVSFKQLSNESSKFIGCKDTGSSVNAWQFSDKTKNDEYFNKLHSENELDYKVNKLTKDRNEHFINDNDNELYADEIKIVKLFVARLETRDSQIVNRPTASVLTDFEAFISELGCETINRMTFNKVMESLGYQRKNLAINRIILTDEEKEIETQKDTKVMRCWIKTDLD